MAGAGVPAWRWYRRALATGACLAVTVLSTGAAAQTSDAMLSVTPSPVTAGTAHWFRLEFSARVNFDGGSITLEIPQDWPAPAAPLRFRLSVPLEGEVICVTGECAQLAFSQQNIMIMDVSTATTTVVAVDYYATVPATSALAATFTASVMRAAHSLTETFSATETINPASASTPTASPTASISPTASPSPTVATSPVTSISPAPASSPTAPTPRVSATSSAPALSSPSQSRAVSTPSFPSTSAPPHRGVLRLLVRDTPVPAGLALAAGLGVVLFARSRQRHRPALAPGSSVQAVPRDGPPTRLSIRVTGTQPTRTVRIEPHSGTTTTNEEPEP